MGFGKAGFTWIEQQAESLGQAVDDFIAADPATLSVPAQAVQKAARLSCEVWGNVPSGIQNASAFPGTFMNSACKKYYDDNLYDAPSFNSSYGAGLCPTNYTVCREIGGVVSCVSGVFGPITEYLVLPAGANNRAFVRNGTGNLVPIGGAFGPPEVYPPEDVIWLTPTRDDGLPDDCGPLVEQWETGNNPPPLPQSPVDIPSGDGWDITVGVPVVFVDAKGEINFNVDIGGVEVNLGGDPNDPTPTPAPVEQPPVATGEETELEAPDDTCIVAVRIAIANGFTGGTEVPLNGGETLVIPRHGNLTFVDESGYNTDTISVRLDNQVIPAPPGICWKKVISSPVPNVSWSAAIVTQPIEER